MKVLKMMKNNCYNTKCIIELILRIAVAVLLVVYINIDILRSGGGISVKGKRQFKRL